MKNATDYTLDQLKALYDQADYGNPNIKQMVESNHILEDIGFWNDEGDITVGWENYIHPPILHQLSEWVENERM